MELDLSGCLAEDEGVQDLLARLPALKVLHLSSCRKLSQSFVQGAFPVHALSSGNSKPGRQIWQEGLDSGSSKYGTDDSCQHESDTGSTPKAGHRCFHSSQQPVVVRNKRDRDAMDLQTGRSQGRGHLRSSSHTHLHAIDLQRCWQLNTRCLDHLLAHASLPGSQLRTLALSHLSLSDWCPPESANMSRDTSDHTQYHAPGMSVMDTESASSGSAGSSSEQESMLHALTGLGSAAADGVDAESPAGMSQHQRGSSSSSSSESASSAGSIMNVTEASGGDLLVLPPGSTRREVQHRPNERSEASTKSLDGIRAGTLGGFPASTGSGLCILALNNCVRLGPVGMRVSHLAWPTAFQAIDLIFG